jgi:hypothetical protein
LKGSEVEELSGKGDLGVRGDLSFFIFKVGVFLSLFGLLPFPFSVSSAEVGRNEGNLDGNVLGDDDADALLGVTGRS